MPQKKRPFEREQLPQHTAVAAPIPPIVKGDRYPIVLQPFAPTKCMLTFTRGGDLVWGTKRGGEIRARVKAGFQLRVRVTADVNGLLRVERRGKVALVKPEYVQLTA